MISPCCEHPFSSSRSGMAEVKEWNRDSYSQRQRKLNSTRHKHCQFLSKDKIIRKNCLKTSDWKQPLLCAFYSNQPGCRTAWSSGSHFVLLFSNHSVSMFHPAICQGLQPDPLLPSTWQPIQWWLHQMERLSNGKERLPHSWIYFLAENRFKSRINSIIICATGISGLQCL